ncbi:MAG: HNH endonuclease [Akkermansiaceae bacterium]|nr:HNH endonuclease [Akkermansiaceae bacterium]
MHNRDRNNREFDLTTRRAVWAKGQVVSGYDPAAVRKDTCGKLIKWEKYGDTNSEQGWETDHIKPKAKEGGDELSNLQPLQWRNNRTKGDNYPHWDCAA